MTQNEAKLKAISESLHRWEIQVDSIQKLIATKKKVSNPEWASYRDKIVENLEFEKEFYLKCINRAKVAIELSK
jgi:hypothetical protein